MQLYGNDYVLWQLVEKQTKDLVSIMDKVYGDMDDAIFILSPDNQLIYANAAGQSLANMGEEKSEERSEDILHDEIQTYTTSCASTKVNDVQFNHQAYRFCWQLVDEFNT